MEIIKYQSVGNRTISLQQEVTVQGEIFYRVTVRDKGFSTYSETHDEFTRADNDFTAKFAGVAANKPCSTSN